jgi:3-phenylpropionate/trans-cinnamate dioxygenase ferredoxin reductase component
VHEADWYASSNVELLLGTRATGLDPAKHTLTVDGARELRFDKLLLATGSRVRTLDVPGTDLAGVRYLRTIDESDALLRSLRPAGVGGGGATRVVIVGAGWIGLETAAAARGYGAEVTVVELDKLPLRRVLGDEVAGLFAQLHRDNGVTFHFGASVAEFSGADGRLDSVLLGDGTRIPADLAIVGVGITPAVELAQDGDLHVDNGVVTDESLVTSHPDVYACGDVANSHNPLLGKRIRVEHWANALNGGKVAAQSMLGQQVTYARLPYFFSDQYDLGMEYSGYVQPGEYDRVVFRGESSIVDGKAPECIVFWTREGQVVAGMNINVWDVTDGIQALVRAGLGGRAVDLGRLADPAASLESLLG